ncbi:MAG: glycosyltransferase, partial [Deltaproteobacteria bacterium]|nr:glycosyltransferase [Deltaproteobacteria bacterium]
MAGSLCSSGQHIVWKIMSKSATMTDRFRIILFSSSTSSSGGTRQAMYLARALSDDGWDCQFFIPEGATIIDKDPGLEWRRLIGSPSTWRAQLMREVLPGRTVVHAFHGQAVKLVSIWGLGELGHAAAVVANRGVTFFPRNPLPYWSPGIDAFVVNSESCARQLSVILVPRRKIHVVYNGVPSKRSVANRGAEAVREELEIDRADLIVGTVAGNNPVKGADILMKAFARLRRPGLVLVLVGVSFRDWKEKIDTLELAETIRVVGFTENVADYLRAFDVFVLPSRRESMPNTLMEAMMCGLPTVASCVGGVPEVAS